MSAKKATDIEIVDAIVKTRGRVKNAAAMLGMTHGALSPRLKKPEIQKKLQDIRDECLKGAKISSQKVYNQLAKQLDAGGKKRPNWKAQDSARKDALKLMGHTADIDKVEGDYARGPAVIMPVVVIDGNPLQFKVGNNG